MSGLARLAVLLALFGGIGLPLGVALGLAIRRWRYVGALCRNGKTPARDIGVLRPGEQTDADRQEAILRENLLADEQARAQGLMTA